MDGRRGFKISRRPATKSDTKIVGSVDCMLNDGTWLIFVQRDRP